MPAVVALAQRCDLGFELVQFAGQRADRVNAVRLFGGRAAAAARQDPGDLVELVREAAHPLGFAGELGAARQLLPNRPDRRQRADDGDREEPAAPGGGEREQCHRSDRDGRRPPLQPFNP